MRLGRPIWIAFLLFPLAGCSSNNEGRIEDTLWVCEAQTVNGNNLPHGALVLAFRADGSMTCTRQFTDAYPGRYTLSMGDYVTFRFDRPYGDTKATVHTEKITINGDKMTMVDADGTVVKFTRAKEGDVPKS
ncbi:MAG TPA: hypothetical protein VGJ05_15425 [Fimbriiglobus sp.]|jgi:hypothetical protein